jgi:hypothetical protein
VQRSARIVVVTSLGLSLGAGCAERVVANPPPLPVAPPPVTPPPAVPPPGTHDHTRFTVVLNGADASDRRVYKSPDGSCYVVGAWVGPPPTSYVPPPTEATPCPPHMDATWTACAFGTVQAVEDGSECLCAVTGNPPAPPRVVACPTAPPRPALPEPRSE